MGAGYFTCTPPTPRLTSEADVLPHPLQSHLALGAGSEELVGDGVTVPPHVPVRLQRVDEPEAGGAEELAVDVTEVAFGEQRHVADAHQGLLATDVQIVGGRAQLHQVELGAAVPGTHPVAVLRDPLAPVVRAEDQAAGRGVAHHRTVDAVQAGIADERTLGAFQDVDAPVDDPLLAPDAVEPLVLALLGRRHLAAKVARDLVALHATVLNEQRHVVSLQRGHLDGEITHVKAHNWSEHSQSPSCSDHARTELPHSRRSNDRINLQGRCIFVSKKPPFLEAHPVISL